MSNLSANFMKSSSSQIWRNIYIIVIHEATLRRGDVTISGQVAKNT